MRGWWNMVCFNGLSLAQQTRLIEVGNLPIDYQPEGTCPNGAEVGIETQLDRAPGPRFYCRPCAVEYLQGPMPSPRAWPECPECHATWCMRRVFALGKGEWTWAWSLDCKHKKVRPVLRNADGPIENAVVEPKT